MEFAETLDPSMIIVLAIVLVAGWILLRVALKLTMALFRIGCFIIFIVIAGAFTLSILAG